METLSTLSVMKEFANINKLIDLISLAKSNYEPSPIGTKAFDVAIQNRKMKNEDLPTLPKPSVTVNG